MNDIKREGILGSLDFLAMSDPKHANIIKATIDLITEDERRIKQLTEEKEKAQADAIKEFLEKAERYYTALKGNTFTSLVAYHLKQIAGEMIGGKREDDEY